MYRNTFYEKMSTSKKYNIFIKGMSQIRLLFSKKYVKPIVLFVPSVDLLSIDVIILCKNSVVSK